MTWPDECLNLATLAFNGVACCLPRHNLYLGACPVARGGGCYADFGEWGAWRAVLAEMCEDINDPDNCYTVEYYLEMVGWSP